MKTESQHTPTPWFYDEGGFSKGGTVRQSSDQRTGSYIRAQRDSGAHPAVCKMLKIHGYEQNQANAAFIVRAVNAHQELLGVLKAIAGYTSMPNSPEGRDLTKRLLEAIAKSEGK